MPTPYLRKPSPFLVSPVEINAAALPYAGDSEKIAGRRASIATNLRNVGYAAMVLTAGATAGGISEHAHSPYSTLSLAVAMAGAGRLAFTYVQAATITSELIASGHAETFEQMLITPGEVAFAKTQMPPTSPGVE
jgi:hypothetical protein